MMSFNNKKYFYQKKKELSPNTRFVKKNFQMYVYVAFALCSEDLAELEREVWKVNK